jgi:AraC family transcriptional regulator of adaptative response / DNA-3-methyladenine glycosylase II
MTSFPTAHEFLQAADADLVRAGLMRRRVQTLKILAQAIASDELRLEVNMPLEETLAKLRSISGIGEWTVQYLAMRALGWPNALPPGDSVLKKLAPSIVQRSPWCSYAVVHLWDQHQLQQ